MPKGAKAARKRAQAVGGGPPEELRRAERAALKRLRRLEAELDAARRAEARRRKQLTAAEAVLRDVVARVAELAATVREPASEAAHDLVVGAHERLEDLAGSGTETMRGAATSVARSGRGLARAAAAVERRAANAAIRSRRPSAADPAVAAVRPALAVAGAGAGIAGGTDTPTAATRWRRSRSGPAAAETTADASSADTLGSGTAPDESSREGTTAGGASPASPEDRGAGGSPLARRSLRRPARRDGG